MKLILSFCFLIFILSCDISYDKGNKSLKNRLNIDDLQLSDINYSTLRYDTLIINELTIKDFTINVVKKLDTFKKSNGLEQVFYYSTYRNKNKMNILKHINYINYNKNSKQREHIKVIEFIKNNYNYKLFVLNDSKAVYLKWKNEPNYSNFNFYTDLCISNITDTLFTNLNKESVYYLFPLFKKVLLPIKSSTLTLDYKYSIDTLEFYDNLVLE